LKPPGYNAASNACVSASRWPEALALLENAALGHLDLDRISYTTAINAYERGDKWQEAIALLASFPGEADAILFNAAINACADQWQKCVLLLNQMQQDQIQANIITFGAIISACRNSKEWREAVHILGFMQRSHVETNAIVCNAAINACGRAEYWPHALQILVMMEKAAEMVISKDADEKLVEGHQILTKTHHDDP
jgi:pentatricopeptide repeat domain-containing protein 1